jgi:hypothetical protein
LQLRRRAVAFYESKPKVEEEAEETARTVDEYGRRLWPKDACRGSKIAGYRGKASRPGDQKLHGKYVRARYHA